MIAVDGSVSSVEVTHNASLPPDVIVCTKEKARSWVFPMNGATVGADVRFTVVFSPTDSSGPPPK